MIKYPNGFHYEKNNIKGTTLAQKEKIKSISSANRGMRLEDDINLSNDYYRNKKIALITKRPTPINVVKVDYSKNARIIDAYFEKQSTTDYNGVYKGCYIDFEVKNTKNTKSFPLANIYKHQIEHLQDVIYHGGIAFFIIEFEKYNEIYLLDAKFIIDFYNRNERKSIPYEGIKMNGVLIRQSFNPRLDYIKAIDDKYFNK